MKVPLYNQEGKEKGDTVLPNEIFGVPFNANVLHQVVVALAANRRQVVAHAKTRSEVRGGGRKPWRQKGTGRARHGSIRSPLWKGGGVTFGPRKERVFKQKLNKKMRRKALCMALSEKAKRGLLYVLDELKLEAKKTKLLNKVLHELPFGEGRSKKLIILSRMDANVLSAARNLPDVQTIQAKDLNVLDAVSAKYLVMPKEAVEVMKKTFLKKE